MSMSENIGWKFPGCVGGTQTGLRNSGIETFKEHVLLSFAKEICQNSLDARIDETKPVIVEISKFGIEKDKFPGHSEFLEALNQLIHYWSNTKNDKSAEEFFRDAKTIINQNKIPCIRISDFNTTGLEGSNNEDSQFTNWQLLVKSEGACDKPITAGGSYGIGKFASFACSRVRTVFYSTNDSKGVKAHQGVARLASWKNNLGETTNGTGYYGNKINLSHLSDQIYLENGFKRKDSGTDIYIIGFDDRESNWEDQIIASVIDHFMLAIMKGNLVFRIDGRELNKSTLGNFIEEYKKEKYGGLLHENTLDYYYILTHDEEIKEFSYKFSEIDDIKFKVIIKQGFNNKVGVLRNNGMKIFDKDHLPNIASFSGVLMLEGAKASSYFRKLENPQHDSWEPDRLLNGKEEAKKEIRKLFDFVRESIRKLVAGTNPEVTDAFGINEYLPDDPENEGDTTKEETLDGTIALTDIKKPTTKPGQIILPGEEEYEEGGGKPGEHDSKTKGGNRGSEPSETGNGLIKTKVIPLKKLRIFSSKEDKYIIKFSIEQARPELNLCLNLSGETINEKANIHSAKRIYKNKEEELKVEKNKIKLKSVNSGEDIVVEFKLKEEGKWCMEVQLNEDISK